MATRRLSSALIPIEADYPEGGDSMVHVAFCARGDSDINMALLTAANAAAWSIAPSRLVYHVLAGEQVYAQLDEMSLPERLADLGIQRHLQLRRKIRRAFLRLMIGLDQL